MNINLSHVGLDLVSGGKDGYIYKRRGTNKYIAVLRPDYDGNAAALFVKKGIHPFVFNGKNFIDLLNGEVVPYPWMIMKEVA